jgi:hypothetical protein
LTTLIEKLASADVQNFIFTNEHADADRLVLSNKDIAGMPAAIIAGQLKARAKASHKLPTYYETKGIVYPPGVNLEQSSSEATARFKRNFIRRWIASRRKFCDLTGGLGIDSFFIGAEFETGDFVEPNEALLTIASHNHQVLQHTGLNYHHTNAESFLNSASFKYDLIYIDPSRRDSVQKKVFRFADCDPNVAELHAAIFSLTTHLLVKASPLLDIQLGIRELSNVERVIVVAVDNECKELLFATTAGFASEPLIECCNILNSSKDLNATVKSSFQFRFSEERVVEVKYSDPLKYIYEPDASIMKGGAFKSVAARYDINKLQVNTHLYTSDHLLNDFPGRAFEITGFVKPDKKLRNELPDGKANIITRNYPLSVDELKKKTGVAEGGEAYLLACSGVKEKFVMIARRLY